MGDRFVVEGARTIRQLLDQGWPLESVLLTGARAEGRPDLVTDALAAGADVYIAEPVVFDRITGFHIHRGALALAPRPPLRSLADVVAGARLVLVVEGVNDLENLGALFRNAAAFGAGAVVLDPSSADPLYRRSVRVSVGHVLRVPFTRIQSWPDGLVELRAGGFRLVALTPAGDLPVAELNHGLDHGLNDGGARWAVMVGAEGPGLSAAAVAAADVSVRIPLAGGVDSLNVATAAAIALHRLSPVGGGLGCRP